MAKYYEWTKKFKTFDDPFCQILLAYSAGDAFGAFYEFNGSHLEVPNELKAKVGWPIGGVSDDTALTLLTIKSMESENPGTTYLKLLKENLGQIRGLGPTTRRALGLEVKDYEPGELGNTNGALMRSALCGLANFSNNQIRCAIEVTHDKVEAIEYALMLVNLFRGAEIPNFSLPTEEVSLSPKQTYKSVCAVVVNSKSVSDTYLRACSLGGDTDTVAALSGALYLRKFGDPSFLEIDWLEQINWDEISEGIDQAVTILRRNS
jgi:ADP-ribosylglycohydrolase